MLATKMMRRLIDDAVAKGHVVVEQPSCVDVTTPCGVGITIWEDGVATRNDVELSLAVAIRTQKQMRKILNLEK